MRRYQQISRTRIANIFKMFVERGSVRRKSLESEGCPHVRGQQESMYNGSKACAGREMSGGRRGKRIRASPGPLFSQELLSLNRSLSHTHTDTHTEGWIHAPLSGLPLLLISLTRGLQHFLPVHQEILKPDPTVSHGDLLEEVGHSSVFLSLLSHLFPSRMNDYPVSIL